MIADGGSPHCPPVFPTWISITPDMTRERMGNWISTSEALPLIGRRHNPVVTPYT